MKEMVGGCCVCSDERGWPDNPLVYCDGNGCTVAVHQACYGIITVPTGPWFCRKCESPETKGKVKCELCPSKSGALKRSDTGGWAHVVCALYIPEVRFGNVTSMEPIVLRLIPQERFNKTCYICQDLGKTHRANAGACMQCNKSGCKQQFHVTCAQSLGLLCEEAGNYLDNVKYCGYCQHHYSKLKKGGNVKTIPPYKPVTHDSQSSDSSGEKEGGGSPMAGGSGTPTHATKAKGPGRKSSHSNNSTSGKSTPNAAKVASNSNQSVGGKGHHSADKAKKPSPSRRASSASDAAPMVGSGGSKASTPARSPQHPPTPTDNTPQAPGNKNAGNATPNNTKTTLPLASPSGGKQGQEPVGVISSVATATAAAVVCSTPPPSTSGSTSVVQSTNSLKSTASYQESVITNAESIDSKQTKKRKAANAASNSTPVDYATPNPPPSSAISDGNSQNANSMWENSNHVSTDVPMDNIDKNVKKAKTDSTDVLVNSHFSNVTALPVPQSPAPQPSPRHLPSPNILPGPSGISNIRSPSQHQGGKIVASGEREGPASLLVSVPLPSTSQGLNLSAHAQLTSMPSNEIPGPSHIFHSVQKAAAMEQPMAGHSSHSMPGRSSWGGLNVSYEMQQPDMSKPSTSGLTVTNKDGAAAGPSNTNIRNKKRAAMGASVVAMANASTSGMQTPQTITSARRAPQPTPPPIYQETIKDSPPSSPGNDRPLKPKMENKMIAPHMLGNELNPESGAAARLQEQLSAELAAHAAVGSGPSPLVPPPLLNKATQGSSGGRSSTSSAQSLDQLLERQWEQGSQFLMEQAQHFDIASLLSCLHQLRTENVRLEEHVGSLLQRRDHLLAVNARLAIPLTVTPGPPEQTRCSRDNGSQVRSNPGPSRNETITGERAHQMMDPTYVQLMMREVQQKPS